MKIKCLALCVCSLLVVSGCTMTNWLNKRITPPVETGHLEFELIDSHLTLMQDITSRDYQQQQQLYSTISNIQEKIGDARSHFRHALLLLTSGHPNSDPGRGYIELKQLLDDANELTEQERSLGQVLLNEAENSMILEARNTELTSAASINEHQKYQDGNSNRARSQRTAQQLRTAERKIVELQSQLEEARDKLDEIKKIEVLSE